MYIGRLARVSGNKARGYMMVTGPNGNIESETYTCAHCNGGVSIPRNADEEIAGKMCLPCNQMICPHCAKTGICEPFEKKLDASEKAMRSKMSIFAAAGLL